MPIDPAALGFIAQLIAPGGIAAIAVKAVLNGTKERVKDIHASVEKIDSKVDKISDDLGEIDKRVVRLEVLSDVE